MFFFISVQVFFPENRKSRQQPKKIGTPKNVAEDVRFESETRQRLKICFFRDECFESNRGFDFVLRTIERERVCLGSEGESVFLRERKKSEKDRWEEGELEMVREIEIESQRENV